MLLSALLFPASLGLSAATLHTGMLSPERGRKGEISNFQLHSYTCYYSCEAELFKKSSKTIFFPKGSFFTLPSCSLPWVMLTHLLVLGCPALETSTNPPTPPGEAMPSIEEATLILFLGFSCWVGAKGCSINEVSQLAKSVPNSLGAVGREHSLLVRPSGWMGWLIPLKREPKKKKRTRINL